MILTDEERDALAQAERAEREEIACRLRGDAVGETRARHERKALERWFCHHRWKRVGAAA